jgi:SAM-dependent methyltransferase
MKTLARFYKRYVSPIFSFRPRNLIGYIRFARMLYRYHACGGQVATIWPILGEDTATTAVDPHYFYQGAWVAQHIARKRPSEHIDVGSQTDLVGFLTAITEVTFVDVRPISVSLPSLHIVRGSILDMPYDDASVVSLSCLHVAEHIGLGRYGDPLDPEGTRKACAELARILAPGGTLYFSLPIGRERTEFNAHRIHYPSTIIRYFSDLQLKEFSVVDDAGVLVSNVDTAAYDQSRYACGLFCFIKELKKSEN